MRFNNTLKKPDVEYEMDIEFQRQTQDSTGRKGRASSKVCLRCCPLIESNTSPVINNQEKVVAGLDPNECRVRAD